MQRKAKAPSTTSRSRDGAVKKATTRTQVTRRATSDEQKAPVLLSGGNPQIARALGDAPVQAYFAALPGWKRDVGRQLDALITRAVPNVQKAVKYNSPFYGIKGQGWFLGMHAFTNYLKVTFFQGTSLRPPPEGGITPDARWINIHEGDLDEAQMVRWLKQAAELPGWLTADIR